MRTIPIHLTKTGHVLNCNHMLHCLGALGLKRLNLVQLFFLLLQLLLNLDVALSTSTQSLFLLQKKNSLLLLSVMLLAVECPRVCLGNALLL